LKRNIEDTQIMLGALGTPTLKVINPIPVNVTRGKGMWVLEVSAISEFGCGDDLQEAMSDLQGTLRELFETLHAGSAKLGRDLKRVFAWLEMHIEKTAKPEIRAEEICEPGGRYPW